MIDRQESVLPIHDNLFAQAPLRIDVVWHPDYLDGESFAHKVFCAMAFDPLHPGEVKPAIPVRFWTEPLDVLIDASPAPTVIIVLIDDSMLESNDWEAWLAKLSSYAHSLSGKTTTRIRILPVAVRDDIHANVQLLGQMNFLARRGTKDRDDYLLNQILISILSFIDPQRLYYEVFLSYSRSDGANVRDELLNSFRPYPYLRPFVDENDVIVGAFYRDRFASIIDSSAFIAIQTDEYSSRTETVREFEYAKRVGRPIVVVDALTKGEPRSFAYIGNNRVIRFSANQGDILAGKLLTEVLCYELYRIEARRLERIVQRPLNISLRTPDLYFLALRERKKDKASSLFVYPDPPLTYPELRALQQFDSKSTFLTPVQYWCSHAKSQELDGEFLYPLQGLEVQLSVSPPGARVLEAEGFRSIHVEEWLIEFARYLVAAGATIVFGGKFSSDAVGSWILRILEVYGHSESPQAPRLRAFMPFPVAIALSTDERKNLGKHLYLKMLPAPDDVRKLTKDGRQMPRVAGSNEWKYVWARSMTETRKAIANSVHATIVIGGKESGYLGRYAGVVEEALCAIEADNPLYIVGGLGGCAKSIFSALNKTGKWPSGDSLDVGLPAIREIDQSNDAETFLEYYNHKVSNNDKTLRVRNLELKRAFWGNAEQSASILKNGLTADENRCLGLTTNLRESIHYVIKGLTTIRSRLINI